MESSRTSKRGGAALWLIFVLSLPAVTSATGGCGEGRAGDGSLGLPGGAGGGNDAGRADYDLEGCVVSVLATACNEGLPAPHQIELLNAATGEPLPGLRTTSAPGGKYVFHNVPGAIDVALHAIGVGSPNEGTSTYDSIAFHSPGSGDNLLRVSSVGTAGIAGSAAAFTAKDDYVALSGAVYQVDQAGRRIGTVGCAKVYVDDAPHPAEAFDQRYNASNGIPTTLARLDRTLAGSGRFYFGNLSVGEHTLRVSMDDGATFVAEKTIVITRARQDADSPFKALLYLVGIDISGANPTPAGCPTEERS